ncbi:hypothetical protein Sa4125_16750 [Aureimonas sp. SA4125]|uniref:DUF6352 family protein n=1 Tax=Aureimonas sp. SA4125 TaxID=2826993 RepID=UPI001CC69886|nr:DUF6352 family protein [Aureimonas sp. SA4125]BDA84133.1 hypothetical protein Sa4125_16750 [Aureimonas sp. SA4125]
MTDFWVSSGHQLLDRDENGRLVLTDDYLKAHFARPELMPPPEACAAERSLHSALLDDPRRAVEASEIAALEDADAQENWRVMLAFRDRLASAPTLEAAYLELVRGSMRQTPPLFVNQLTQVILRNVLDGCDDAHVLRAAELFFRPQRASVEAGALLLADAEIIELQEDRGRSSPPLLQMFAEPVVTELDVLTDENAASYVHRSESFDLVLSFSGGVASRRGLARVIELWVAHLLGVTVTVTPEVRADEEDWAWFVGLDAEATRIGNALWRGEHLGDGDAERIIGLFALRFSSPEEALPVIGARPVWLLLAMTPSGEVRMKPQNLVVGLPLRTQEETS